MGLSALRVIHQSRASYLGLQESGQQVRALSDELRGAFIVETCQRRLWITTAPRLASVNVEWLEGTQQYKSFEAYGFLLRVAAGLESEIKGETEIFGQIKCAWQTFSTHRTGDFKALAPLIRRLFEDTKEIRSRYLQGFGGSSYGSLVRKMLRQRSRGPVLLAGAGQLAEAVLPYLREFDVLVWNRSEERLRSMVERARISLDDRIQILPAKAELQAWRSAAHAVVCIPTDSELDAVRIEAWKAASFDQADRSLIHLGCTDHDPGRWLEVENFFPLKDLFEIQKSQDRARTEQIEKAIQACHVRTSRRGQEFNVTPDASLESLALLA